jgi:hypothetical protein
MLHSITEAGDPTRHNSSVAMTYIKYVFPAIGIGLFLTTAAFADEPTRVEGKICTAEDGGTDTWFGFFKGQREVFSPLKSGEKSKAFTKLRCFSSGAECNSWKYWMEVDFPNSISEASCRKGD